jgi:metal-responsive CopG/Arc/MetJ family transcriptional regulator
VVNIKDRRIFIKVSEKMFDEFNESLGRNEETKSEVLRACIREYIKKNSDKNK